jgi:hypothetical protein
MVELREAEFQHLQNIYFTGNQDSNFYSKNERPLVLMKHLFPYISRVVITDRHGGKDVV